MNRVLLVSALGAAFAAACGGTTDVLLTQLNLDRPVDISFACFGDMLVTAEPGTKPIATAQPRAACDGLSTPTAADPPSHPMGQLTGDGPLTAPSWFGFILQPSSGTVAIAEWKAQPADAFLLSNGNIQVLDADPLTPGKNAISVGEDPVAIVTDKSGCYEVIANAGSADLSVLDVNSAVNAVTGSRIRVDRFPVTNAAGQVILARPAAMVAQPNTDVVGARCPTRPGTTPGVDQLAPDGVVYVAYPSCHLVAAIAMSTGTGKIVKAIQFDGNDVAHLLPDAALQTLTCANERDGMAGTPGTRPVTLDLKVDTRGDTLVPLKRLVIGADNSRSITLVELDADALPVSVGPSPVSQIALEQQPGTQLGVTTVALSPYIGMGNSNDTPGQYVYAVATDGTVRVADVLDKKTECDTQVDARFVRTLLTDPMADPRQLFCFPVGAPTTPPRRSGVKGPGIELVGPGGDGVPTSVMIFKGLSLPSATAPQTTLVGYFAIITSTGGDSFVVNVDDDIGPIGPDKPDTFDPTRPMSTSPVLTMAHQLRDAFANRDAPPPKDQRCVALDPADIVQSGGPRTSTLPARNIPIGTVGPGLASRMPGLQQYRCEQKDSTETMVLSSTVVSELQFGATSQVRDVAYPDLRNTLTEGWTMTWEGPLSANNSANSVTTIDGPQIRVGQMEVSQSGMSLVDQMRPFCEMGVEKFDIVQLRGCNPVNGNAECPSGYTCYIHPRSKVSGLGSCMLPNDATHLADACFDFLATSRRYTVSRAETGRLVLLPRRHTLYATPIDGCTSDDQCNALASYVVDPANPNRNAAGDPFVAGTTKWACQTDELRAPINPDATKDKRCVQTCGFHSTDPKVAGSDGLDRDADCAPGSICLGATPTTRAICMEGVQPPAACVLGPQPFDVRASEAFTVIGSHSGFVHPITAQGGGACAPAANPNRLQIGRIPLKAPACNPAANPFTGAVGAGFEPNPCSLPVSQVEFQHQYLPGTCTPDPMKADVIGTRDAPAIKFSNRAMTLHLVDPTFSADCSAPGQPPLDRVSLIVPGALTTALGYQLAISQTAGFLPMVLPGVSPVFPVKVVRGPTESIWLLDDGDFLSSQPGQPSTRGQVFRIESININGFNLVQ